MVPPCYALSPWFMVFFPALTYEKVKVVSTIVPEYMIVSCRALRDPDPAGFTIPESRPNVLIKDFGIRDFEYVFNQL
jgi:hypothetical protein